MSRLDSVKPTAPPLAAVLEERTVSQAALTRAIMDEWSIEAFGKGHEVVIDGVAKPQMAHIVFKGVRAAEEFIRYHKLAATGTARGSDAASGEAVLKKSGVHPSYPGKAVVRLTQEYYYALAIKYKLPDFGSLLVSVADNIDKQPYKQDASQVPLSTARAHLAEAMNLSEIIRGNSSAGFVQMIFKTQFDAKRFIRNHEIVKENDGDSIDSTRYRGLFTVRLLPEGDNMHKLRAEKGDLIPPVEEIPRYSR